MNLYFLASFRWIMILLKTFRNKFNLFSLFRKEQEKDLYYTISQMIFSIVDFLYALFPLRQIITILIQFKSNFKSDWSLRRKKTWKWEIMSKLSIRENINIEALVFGDRDINNTIFNFLIIISYLPPIARRKWVGIFGT